MPEALYGVCSFLVSDTKMLIFGGFSEMRKNSHKVYTIDLNNGSISYLSDITEDIWTTLSPYYFNGSIYVVSTGEEVDEDTPQIIKFPIQLPMP